MDRPWSHSHAANVTLSLLLLSQRQGLLKEKLELEKIKTKDGRTRVTLKPIDDELTFDKVIP